MRPEDTRYGEACTVGTCRCVRRAWWPCEASRVRRLPCRRSIATSSRPQSPWELADKLSSSGLTQSSHCGRVGLGARGDAVFWAQQPVMFWSSIGKPDELIARSVRRDYLCVGRSCPKRGIRGLVPRPHAIIARVTADRARHNLESCTFHRVRSEGSCSLIVQYRLASIRLHSSADLTWTRHATVYDQNQCDAVSIRICPTGGWFPGRT
ncbi:uncharacterized protein C8Q71DRAFT_235245 [Rhodofomes roseus]|uniref:Uncharacterized protein n=1 Tax=Rhodofomes roseus TaxID=34475 RepID=A0ABQ8KVV6_9APHY|nr:uncharacterized protein C8Q71DRAFT_235245 [Rhodofomes roseus]KAH9843109.1 hypothetical protein C8Q71DRAFT_235245 [Rhodofomes roseus]